MKSFLSVTGATALYLLANLAIASTPLDDAQRLFAATNYSAAAERLRSAQDAPSLRLLGRSYLMLNHGYLWLGRAYGMRAEKANPLSAPSLANKTRQNLEKAFSLDPKNWDAADDLFEYYLEAPGFLGGGLDKASDIADRIAAHDPAQASVAHARIAERRKDFAAAEQLYRKAVQQAPQQTERHVDLARFLAGRGRYDESDAEFALALHAAPNTPKVVFSLARALVQTKRNLPEARELLTKYLAMKLTPEDPSREDAEKLLRKASGS
jgi:tetratricopeptide (TPR) repeat protein